MCNLIALDITSLLIVPTTIYEFIPFLLRTAIALTQILFVWLAILFPSEFSASGGVRTHDNSIKSRVLYQLSYGRKAVKWFGFTNIPLHKFSILYLLTIKYSTT